MCCLLVLTGPAAAVEIFGLRVPGTEAELPPGWVGYETALTLVVADNNLRGRLAEASLLALLEKEGAADLVALTARARADQKRLTAALYAEGYYGGTIAIRIGGKDLKTSTADGVNEITGSSGPVTVDVLIDSGPSFRFGRIEIVQPAPSVMAAPIAAADYGLLTGEIARSDRVLIATERMAADWRLAGYPYVKVAANDVTADHASQTLNVRIDVEPGPLAAYGWVAVNGTESLAPETVLAQSALQPGKTYTPADLKTAQERLRKLDAIESVRIIEGETLDENGGVPITLEVTERKSRYLGVTASVSSLEGGELAAYWGHRNLFGEGERLRIDGAISNLGAGPLEDAEGRLAVNLLKPGIFDIDTDLVSEASIERNRPDTYDERSVKASVGIRHRFDDTLSTSAAFSGAFTRIEDSFGWTDHTLLSLPLTADWDTRDDRLDPARGIDLAVALRPTTDLETDSTYLAGSTQLASYLSLDERDHFILAARFGFSSIVGVDDISDLPASERLFAGGGSSVRGYAYRSIGPSVDGKVVGGLSLVEGGIEARARLTEIFGLVAFLDGAVVSSSGIPGSGDEFVAGAGLGLRYYSSLGPLRLDFAVPLDRQDGQPGFAIYAGLGQAF